MRIARLLTAALVATVVAVLPAGPARAHNSLTDASPAKNATLDRAPDGVELTFLQRVDPEALTITVTDAAGRPVPAGSARADGKTGAIEFDEPPANGVFTVTYRVVSLDGHPVRGSYRFTVDDPSAAPGPSAAASSAPAAPVASVAPEALTDAVPAAAPADDSGPWPLVAGVAAAVLLAAVAVLLVRRRRAP